MRAGPFQCFSRGETKAEMQMNLFCHCQRYEWRRANANFPLNCQLTHVEERGKHIRTQNNFLELSHKRNLHVASVRINVHSRSFVSMEMIRATWDMLEKHCSPDLQKLTLLARGTLPGEKGT